MQSIRLFSLFLYRMSHIQQKLIREEDEKQMRLAWIPIPFFIL